MAITGIRLQHFRSYKDQAFELEPGVNIVVGPNASGKTNLLEALYVASRGRSFRVRDADLISYGAKWARLDVTHASHNRSVKLRRNDLPHKEFVVGANTRRRLSTVDTLPIVLFAPDDLRLLNGSPARRRDYIDQLVAHLIPGSNATLNRYQRALLQRNTLLKHPRPDADELFVWSIKLGELGAQIATWRRDLIRRLNREASQIYSDLAGGAHRVRFAYQSSLPLRSYGLALNNSLQSSQDLKIGHTSAGPHRDDFSVSLDGHGSSSSASRGEVRTLVLVAKLVEARLLEKQLEQKPLLLLDDVFSELDGKRRQQLARAVKIYQTLITTTDADAVIEHFTKKSINIIPLN